MGNHDSRSWTQAASIEETLALWAASLQELKKRIRPLFGQERVARTQACFWKVCSVIATQDRLDAGGQLAILSMAATGYPWSRDWMPMPCAISCATMSIDILQMTMPSSSSTRPLSQAGQRVVRCGAAIHRFSAGKITNCQIGVSRPTFPSWPCVHRWRRVSPKEWTDDPDRLQSHIPCLPGTGFCDQPKLATRMIARAIAAACAIQVGSCQYGLRVGDIEQQLARQAKAMCSGQQRSCVRSWASGDQSPATRRGHRIDAGVHPTGNAVRRGRTKGEAA